MSESLKKYDALFRVSTPVSAPDIVHVATLPENGRVLTEGSCSIAVEGREL